MNFKKDFLQSRSAFLITDPKNILYLSGFPANDKERDVYLLITKIENFILTDSRYTLEANKIPGFRFKEITVKKNLISILTELIQTQKISTINVEEHDLKLSEYNLLKKKLDVKLIPGGNQFSKQREIKSTNELLEIRLAVSIADQTFEFIKNQIKVGLSEKEIAYKIINFIHQKQSEISFFPIVAFGKNSAIPHHQTGNSKLEKQDIILLDYGAKVNNYCSDITRIIFFGPPLKKQVDVYNFVIKAQSEALCALRKFKEARIIDNIARSYLQKHGLPPYQHSTGHGIGLDVHEKPSLSLKSKDTLREGMVFSIEPGVYLPNLFGIRIEDLVCITPNGPEVLTQATKEPIVIG